MVFPESFYIDLTHFFLIKKKPVLSIPLFSFGKKKYIMSAQNDSRKTTVDVLTFIF
jgi:hypothetical protein